MSKGSRRAASSLTAAAALAASACVVAAASSGPGGGGLRRMTANDGTIALAEAHAASAEGTEHFGEGKPQQRRLAHMGPTTTPYPPSPVAHVRLHWIRKGYWQESYEEMFWCMACDGHACHAEDHIILKWCEQSDSTQKFSFHRYDETSGRLVVRGGTGGGEPLVMTAYGERSYRLRPLDYADPAQLLASDSGNNMFDPYHPFELYPYKTNDPKEERCLSTEHHPKDGEHVYAALCHVARRDYSSRWISYDPPVDHRPELDKIDGKECTEYNKCDKCGGDCDYDSDCRDHLKCSVRDAHDPVPGCKGAGVFSRDYCYDPNDVDDAPTTTSTTTKSNGGGQDPHLEYVGDCTSTHQCGLCQGDCDDDHDCAGHLLCQERHAHEPVPGCSGTGIGGRDYCYMPDYGDGHELALVDGEDGDDCPEGEGLCGRCRGDCDRHSDCYGHLMCRFRDGYETVPGCAGTGVSGKDYCYDPNDEHHHQTTTTTTTTTTTSTTTSSSSSPHLVYAGECTAHLKCGLCQGDCDGTQTCADGLVCKERDAYEHVPGCSGRGDHSRDYCYDPRAVVDPGEPDDDITTLANAECTEGHPCPVCRGDCDGDHDCRHGLVCHQRDDYDVPVPGCTGTGTKDYDYCVEPPPGVPLLSLYPHNDNDCPAHERMCGECEGDCDYHDDCMEGYICKFRDGFEKIPGCAGSGKDGKDYCVKDPAYHTTTSTTTTTTTTTAAAAHPTPHPPTPAHPTPSPPTAHPPTPHIPTGSHPPAILRHPECSEHHPCDECEGDCDTHHQCTGELLCLQREYDPYESIYVPGCSGAAEYGKDYCVRPSNHPDGGGGGESTTTTTTTTTPTTPPHPHGRPSCIYHEDEPCPGGGTNWCDLSAENCAACEHSVRWDATACPSPAHRH